MSIAKFKRLKLLNLIQFVLLVFFLTNCSAISITEDIYRINNSIGTIKQIAQNNKSKLTEEEYKVLQEAYQEWQQILQLLDEKGCGIQHVTKDICRLDVLTVETMYESAKQTYEKIREIGHKRFVFLNPKEKMVIRQFDKQMIHLSQVIEDFIDDPKSENQLNVIKALSVLAMIGAKTVPIVIGLI